VTGVSFTVVVGSASRWTVGRLRGATGRGAVAEIGVVARRGTGCAGAAVVFGLTGKAAAGVAARCTKGGRGADAGPLGDGVALAGRGDGDRLRPDAGGPPRPGVAGAAAR
jgi:hypothetical protein